MDYQVTNRFYNYLLLLLEYQLLFCAMFLAYILPTSNAYSGTPGERLSGIQSCFMNNVNSASNEWLQIERCQGNSLERNNAALYLVVRIFGDDQNRAAYAQTCSWVVCFVKKLVDI